MLTTVRRVLGLALVLATGVGLVLLQPQDVPQTVRVHLQQDARAQEMQRQRSVASAVDPATTAESLAPVDEAVACAELQDVGVAPCLPHRVVFVGGLQRSGTSTTVELLQQIGGASALHFDPLEPAHMEAAPWKALVDVHTGRRMKWAYFKEVVATGGAEGKLLQSVFPYRYALFDAKFSPLAALLAHPSALSPLVSNASRRRMWREWRRFWRPAPLLLDKSPENLLMAPFLQRLFGAKRTAFVFVLRHPLCWALVASKWGCVWRPIQPLQPEAGRGSAGAKEASGAKEAVKAPPLECIEHLLEVHAPTRNAHAHGVYTAHVGRTRHVGRARVRSGWRCTSGWRRSSRGCAAPRWCASSLRSGARSCLGGSRVRG